MESVFWRCYPPYIDAYEQTPWNDDEYKKKTPKQAIADLHNAMRSNASIWGVQSVGEMVTRFGSAAMVNDKFVFSCGSITYTYRKKEITKQYVLIGAGKPWDNDVEIIEFPYLTEWNIT